MNVGDKVKVIDGSYYAGSIGSDRVTGQVGIITYVDARGHTVLYDVDLPRYNICFEAHELEVVS